MAVNPAGYVCPLDGGIPRIVTGICLEVVSGGQLVFASGAADAVSSGLNSFAASDIGIATGGSGLQFNGIAIDNQTSGNYVGVATRGIVIVRAYDTVTNGQPVDCEGTDAVSNGVADGTIIGRAWTSATSGNFALVELK